MRTNGVGTSQDFQEQLVTKATLQFKKIVKVFAKTVKCFAWKNSISKSRVCVPDCEMLCVETAFRTVESAQIVRCYAWKQHFEQPSLHRLRDAMRGNSILNSRV